MFFLRGQWGPDVLQKSFSFPLDEFTSCSVLDEDSQIPHPCLWIMGGCGDFDQLKFIFSPTEGESMHETAKRAYKAITQVISEQCVEENKQCVYEENLINKKASSALAYASTMEEEQDNA